MISETGENLDIVINTKTGEDWQAFSTWYSINKNLPDSKVFIVCNRTMEVEIRYFQWIKRLNLRHVFQNPVYHDVISNFLQMITVPLSRGLVGENILLVDAKTIFLSPFDDQTLDYFNRKDYKIALNQTAIFVNGVDLEAVNTMIDNIALEGDPGVPVDGTRFSYEAKDEEDLRSIVNYGKGCGRWIDSMKGCPFSNASRLLTDSMQPNELRVIEMWRKMVPLYNAVL